MAYWHISLSVNELTAILSPLTGALVKELNFSDVQSLKGWEFQSNDISMNMSLSMLSDQQIKLELIFPTVVGPQKK